MMVPNKKHFAISFVAKHKFLCPMLEWIGSHLKTSGLPDIQIRRMELALEEALVNIISYAYPKKQGMIELKYIHKAGECIEFHIKDWGKPFNPLKQKKYSLPTTLETKQEGGLGIFFIRKMVSKIEYTRYHEMNILILKKNF